MSNAARIARLGDRFITFVAMLLVLCMMLYGGYSLYDNWLINQAGYGSEMMKFKPSEGHVYSLAELMKINPDVIGWITVDDTHIDQPIAQGKDDMEYVNKDALGEFALSGSIFLSCLNNKDFSDAYSLTYGHHMENGGMYGDVTKFLDEKYFESHKTGTLYNDKYTWDISLFAVLKTDAGDPVVYNASSYIGSASDVISYLEKNAEHYRSVPSDSQVIALSTCYDTETNGRVIVFGRLENKREVKDS